VRTRLSIEIRVGDRVQIDDGRIVLILESKSGQRARFRVEAEEGTPVRTIPCARSDSKFSEGACTAREV
jgi:pyruvate kinase